jgi:hypothetical protein
VQLVENRVHERDDELTELLVGRHVALLDRGEQLHQPIE